MDRYVAIGEASEALGVSITTLRRWEVEGKLIPERTAGRYDLAKLKPELFHAAPSERKTIAYARVSSHDRDVNAAINLKNLAVSSTVSACGEEGSGLGRKLETKPASVKQESSSKPPIGSFA